MKKFTFPMLLATALVAASCSNEDVVTNEGTENGKNLIWFGSANNSPKTRAGFGASTRIVAQIVSEPRTGADPSSAKYTKAVLTADADGTQSETTFSNVGYAANYSNKYWDDAHGRFSRLSVYAVAIPSQTTKTVDGVATPIIGDAKLTGSLTSWDATTSMTNTIDWSVSTAQTATELNQEDLTYSNNIQETGDNGCYIWNGSAYPTTLASATKHTNLTVTGSDGRLHFEQAGVKCDATPTDDPGHFDKGQMAFKHSLSRIRVKIVKGSTFTEGAFAFATGTTIQLGSMPISGTFNIKEGTWAASPTTGNITKMAPVNVSSSETGYEMATAGSQTNAAGVYEAQMLPGFVFAETNGNNVMEFIIDGNKYFVTNKEMMNALKNGSDVSGDATTLTTEQGMRYVFTVTVGKTKIEAITATIVPWINVTAQEQNVDNSHVTFNFLAATGTTCNKEDIFFYKHEQTLDKVYINDSYDADPEYGWGFGDPATLSGDAAPFSTGWYYKDNQTAYHFRTLNLNAKNALDATNKDKFTITTGATDYHWGAPMKTTANLKYDVTANKGFVGNIEKGIVSAKSDTQLKITELHMMSQIIVTLKNDNTVPEADRVTLDGATVTITKMSKSGTVDMATGYITPAAVSSSAADNSQNMTTYTGDGVAAHSYILSVVPQTLKRGTGADDYIGITIKTTDHNEYYIIEKLSTLLAKTNDNTGASHQATESAIQQWYPNHSYTYTFTLKKSEIKLMSATVANWINVTAANQDITLEQ